MAKIIVFALLGLTIIGFMGWMLGNPQHPQQLVYQQQDSLFPTTVITAGKTRLQPEMLTTWIQRGTPSVLLVDTRTADSFQGSHLPNAINRPVDTLLTLHGLRRLPRHKPIILYGGNEEQNARAVDVMRSSGLTAFYLPGDPDRIPRLPTIDTDISAMAAVGTDNQKPGTVPAGPASEAGEMFPISATSSVTQITELVTSSTHIDAQDDQQGR